MLELTETQAIKVLPTLLPCPAHHSRKAEAAVLPPASARRRKRPRPREAVEHFEDLVDAVFEEARLERPGARVGQALLVGVEDVLFAAAAGVLEKGVDGGVEGAVEDGFQTAFGCVELFWFCVVSLAMENRV